MFFWKPKPPKPPNPPWLYLGWMEISYNDEGGKVVATGVVHYFGRGDDLKERKFECENKSYWLSHLFIQKAVIPWVEGDNLWSPIKNPSDNLKDWTKNFCGFEWKGERWYKPAERIAENVLKFPAVK